MNNITQTIVIIATLTGLFYGFIWLRTDKNLFRSFFKTIPVSLLALGAWIGGGPPLLVIALGLSAFGDAFLSREGKKYFLAGLGAFLMAHLAFIALFVTLPSATIPTTGVIIAVSTVTTALMLLVLTSLWRHLAEMKIPVFFYALAIGAMNISAWTSGQSASLLAGVGLFVFSDSVLAHELFVMQKPATKQFASTCVWFSYLGAQTLIVISLI